jgi:hypothetical protein
MLRKYFEKNGYPATVSTFGFGAPQPNRRDGRDACC